MANNLVNMADIIKKYPALANVPEAIRSQLLANYANDLEGGNDNWRALSLKAFQFTVKSAAGDQVIEGGALNCIILAEADTDHHTWYKNKYDPNAEKTAPDAVWYGNNAPACVPASALQKDPNGRYQYSTHRRAIITILGADGKLSAPVVFDIGALSLYGKDNGGDILNYANYRKTLAKNGLLPCMVMTRVVFNRSQSVPCVQFTTVKNNGQPIILGADQQKIIFDMALSEPVQELKQVKLIPEVQTAPAQTAPAITAPTPQPALLVKSDFTVPASQPAINEPVITAPVQRQEPAQTADNLIAEADELKGVLNGSFEMDLPF